MEVGAKLASGATLGREINEEIAGRDGQQNGERKKLDRHDVASS
jgi:hypothetical protein